jgi:isopropylmalate/homocitrate/citramalate synthase
LSEYESTISFLEELGLAEPLPKCEWRLRFDKIDEVVEQKLSKQVTEEEFKKFMLKVYNDWQNNPDKTAIDYMLEQIFSHYILIPKE